MGKTLQKPNKIYKFLDEDKAEYEGEAIETKNGLVKHGKGELILEDGRKFMGTWN